MTTCTNPKLQVAHELEYRVVRSVGTADGEIGLRAPEDKLVVELKNPSAEELDSGTTVVTQLRCHWKSEPARVHGVRCRVVFFRGETWLGSCQPQVTMLKPGRGRPHVKIVEAQVVTLHRC